MPNKIVEFVVEGQGRFPFDMLRYDSCWPARPHDVNSLSVTDFGNRQITLRSYRMPTEGRWKSFSWPIKDTNRKFDFPPSP